MSRIRILTAGAALAAALGLSACSSSSHGTGSSALSVPSLPSVTSVASVPSVPSQPSAPSSAQAALPGDGGDFCKQLFGAAAAVEHLSDAGVTERQKYLDQLRALAAEAPAAVKADVVVLEQLDEQVINGAKPMSALNSPATAAHLQHFLAWMKTNCPGVLDNLPTS